MQRTKGKVIDFRRLLGERGQPSETLEFQPREMIFKQGDESDAVYYIQEGQVKLTVTADRLDHRLRRERAAVIEILQAGTFFGENALAPNRPRRTNNAVALTNVEAVKLSPSVLIDITRDDAELCATLLAHLVSLKNRLQEDLATSLIYDGEKRLARVLASISDLRSGGGSRPIPRISQQELADMVGVTRQRVNYLLGQFRKSGMITDENGITVRPAILKLAGKD